MTRSQSSTKKRASHFSLIKMSPTRAYQIHSLWDTYSAALKFPKFIQVQSYKVSVHFAVHFSVSQPIPEMKFFLIFFKK